MSSSFQPKPTRSRVSSPHRPSSSSAGHSHSRGGKSDSSRGFMQRWLEPAVHIKPSFQEAGLVRGGVVENMAPLGTMPKAAMLKKAPPCSESPQPTTSNVTRIVLKKSFSTPSGTATSAPTSTTPRATATPALPNITRTSSSESASMTMMEDDNAAAAGMGVGAGIGLGEGGGGGGGVSAGASALLPPASHPVLPMPVDDMDDGDYQPKRSKGRRITQHTGIASSASATPIHLRRQSHRHRSVQSSPAPPPALDHTRDLTPAPTSPTQSDVPSSHRLTREPDDKDQASKIVEVAVEEALRHFRYPTAWALRILYDENSGDPDFLSMIEDIYHQRATPKTIRKFLHLVNEKKKEAKKDNKGCYYFVPPSTGSRFTPHKAEPASYGNLVKMDFATLLRDAVANELEVDNDGHVSKKRKTESADARETLADQADAHTTPTAAITCAASHNIKQEDQSLSPGQTRGSTTKNKSPKGKKTRSGSVTSTSSLSSVPDDAIEDYVSFMDSVDGDVADQTEGNNAQIPAGSMQPISAEQAKPAIKKQIVSPNPVSEQHTPTPTTTPNHSHSRDSSMPAAVATSTVASTSDASHQAASQSTPIKFYSRFAGLGEAAAAFVQKKLAHKSETADNTKTASVDSFVREPREPVELDELPEPGLLPQLPAPPEHARLSRTPAPVLSSRAARAAKRNHDEFDDASSPIASSFRADFEPSSARNSRAATPSNPLSSKKSKTGVRVKLSPMKRKGTSAGIPRGNGERPSPVGNGPLNNQDDNDDSCYTCGGNGELVCCDGCTFSFHFVCIDPPMDQGHIPDEWFCNECQMRYNPPLVNEHKGLFGPLTASLQRKNPRSFRLPENIRDFFEGVKTGAEGEYEEAIPPKPKTNKKNAEEAFDFFKVRNADKAVLCHNCHKGVTDNRPIIPCSVCGLHWHLECLSPPLALPPILRTWRCPCHVDDVLSNLPARLAPAHKYRKIKHMPVIEQNYGRGLANNGWIEIQDDSDDDETAWKENKAFGRVFRVASKGIKQDFISRVRQNRKRSNLQPGTLTGSTPTIATGSQGPQEQQAALALLELANGRGDGIRQVVTAVMAHASPTVLSTIAQGNALQIGSGNLADADVGALETLLSQTDTLKQTITTILEGRTKHTCDGKPSTDLKALTPSSISHDDSTVVDDLKLDISSSQDSEKARDVNDTNLLTNSSMQID
ncbi:hypothetical protein F4861DRAFT_226851 [Xylaria intraflava]|nr:hypothetical protein F4861DRAFT_226851 [Xylaria intraflava]